MSTVSEPLVVIGNGMAAARFVEELASRALGRYAIAVVGEEPRLAYNRVLLSAVLARDMAIIRDRAQAGAMVARARGYAPVWACGGRDRPSTSAASVSPTA